MRQIFKLVAIGSLLMSPFMAQALPFNNDMVETPALKTGSIVRGKPAETIPIGAHEYRVGSKEEALALTNPKKGGASEVANGKRLFEVNCTPCHGQQDEKGVTVSLASQRMLMPGPDLGSDLYAPRPDGLFYGTIHFGGMAVMPRVGYKLSPEETWDIVSYIRWMQKNRK